MRQMPNLYTGTALGQRVSKPWQVFLKRLTANAINCTGQVHCPWDPRASRSSTKPFLTMVQWTDVACSIHFRTEEVDPSAHRGVHPPVTDTITGLEPRMPLDVAGWSENFLVDTGATCSVFSAYSRVFSSQTCTI